MFTYYNFVCGFKNTTNTKSQVNKINLKKNIEEVKENFSLVSKIDFLKDKDILLNLQIIISKINDNNDIFDILNTRTTLCKICFEIYELLAKEIEDIYYIEEEDNKSCINFCENIKIIINLIKNTDNLVMQRLYIIKRKNNINNNSLANLLIGPVEKYPTFIGRIGSIINSYIKNIIDLQIQLTENNSKSQNKIKLEYDFIHKNFINSFSLLLNANEIKSFSSQEYQYWYYIILDRIKLFYMNKSDQYSISELKAVRNQLDKAEIDLSTIFEFKYSNAEIEDRIAIQKLGLDSSADRTFLETSNLDKDKKDSTFILHWLKIIVSNKYTNYDKAYDIIQKILNMNIIYDAFDSKNSLEKEENLIIKKVEAFNLANSQNNINLQLENLEIINRLFIKYVLSIETLQQNNLIFISNMLLILHDNDSKISLLNYIQKFKSIFNIIAIIEERQEHEKEDINDKNTNIKV